MPTVRWTGDEWLARFDLLGLEATGHTEEEAKDAVVELIRQRIGAMGQKGAEIFAMVHGEDLGDIPDDACVVEYVERPKSETAEPFGGLSGA